ncbi:DoxX family protein [Actinokineospora iranica]|uniref:Putative oxidoreductase n=1 Tax=Actinokineospora iranica TaxID=1271860 RepID=A0A1G6S775_9PSEU|nr:DoxX family protein [Actinokineospora iranica]SDD12046.1 putative oxidoreductase [Actinokineospora iranica]
MSRRHLLTARVPAPVADAALLLLRLVAAVVFIAHGWDALGAGGMAAVVEEQRAAGIPLPELAAPFTILTEIIGGVLLALGVLTRLWAAAFALIMLGAWVFVHAPHGIFVQNGGFELVMVLAAVSVTLVVTGPGRYSGDHLIAGRADAVPEPSAGRR